MGSRTKTHKKEENYAYIAGFFDGDGSIMVQIKNRRDTPKGWRVRITVCMYQDSRHEKPLRWMRDQFGIGHVSRRNDAITEYRIDGFEAVESVLQKMEPFVRFKQAQVALTLELINLLKSNRFSLIPKDQRKRIADLVCDIRDENYKSGTRKYSRSQIRSLLTK